MNCPRVVGQKSLKTKYARIVLGRLYAYIMERRCIAEVILCGIGICMEHKWMLGNKTAGRIVIAKQVIKVRIHTEQHRRAGVVGIVYKHLLTLRQVLTRRY